MWPIWLKAMAKELGCLAQGYGNVKGTNTVQFMSHEEIAKIPKHKVVMYAQIVVDFSPKKKIQIGSELLQEEISLTNHSN